MFVVDDDRSARNELLRLLRAASCNVCGFTSANEFLDAIEPEASGCLVLDLRMPGMSGKELAAKLTERGISLSIIVITADDNLETRQTAQIMKAVGFFRKPVDGAALLDSIDWALRTSGSAAIDARARS